jgi:hypothetical protein
MCLGLGIYLILFTELKYTHTEEGKLNLISMKEEFEDTKGAIRIRISKKNRQHNGQKKKYKRTNNDLQTCPFHAMFNQINMYFSHSVCKILML